MFEAATPLFGGLLTALGVGLLIGLVRERRRNDPESGPSAAGLRTHALASIAAATAWHLDPRAFLVLFAIGGALIAVSYRRTAESERLTGSSRSSPAAARCRDGLDSRSPPDWRAERDPPPPAQSAASPGRELISETEVRDGLLPRRPR
jgi:hypothetical protein